MALLKNSGVKYDIALKPPSLENQSVWNESTQKAKKAKNMAMDSHSDEHR